MSVYSCVFVPTRATHTHIHSSFIIHHSSFLTAHCSLLTAHCSLLTAHCSLLTAHCSLLISPPHIRPSPTRDGRQPVSYGLDQALHRYLQHNRKQMETLHNTNPSRSTAEIRERGRSTLIFTGILTAIICLLILLHDTYSAGHVATQDYCGLVKVRKLC
jgi:hypothetical protein